MAVKKNAEVVAETESLAKEQEAAINTEPKYAVRKLRENCLTLFGVSRSTFDGAMHGHTEEEYTKKEVETIINEWLYGKEGKK